MRPMGPWSPAVHEYLRHLETAGFEGSPRVLDIEHNRFQPAITSYRFHPHPPSAGKSSPAVTSARGTRSTATGYP
jgi:hypothetical protein